MTDVTQTASPEQIATFKEAMAEARELRSDANTRAGEAREVLKGLGYSAAAIAMFKKLSDMTKEASEAVFAELCQLLDADPDFDLASAQPDLFATAQVQELKQPKGRKKKHANGNGNGAGKVVQPWADRAFKAAREHLGTDKDDDHPPVA